MVIYFPFAILTILSHNLLFKVFSIERLDSLSLSKIIDSGLLKIIIFDVLLTEILISDTTVSEIAILIFNLIIVKT